VVAAMRAVSSGRNGARKTWSELCKRTFDSATEARRGEELAILERAGAISGLLYQPVYALCERPRVTYRPDFTYILEGRLVVEDVKGTLTRELRVKLAWLREKTGVEVDLVRARHGGWEVERI
jgi:hypothetical protein